MVRYPGLDLLRAIAIGWVLLFHGITEGLGNAWPGVADVGWMGVDLFFVLSGYLIATPLFRSFAEGATPDLTTFYLRRAFRILPAFWFVALLYRFFPSLRESPGIQPLWQFLTFTENFLIDYPRNATFSHAWSLCVEEHFYLIFPLLASALLSRPSWKIAVGAGVVIVGGGMILRHDLWQSYVAVLGASRSAYVELIYYPTYTRLDGLFAGVMLATVRVYRPQFWARLMRHPYWLLATGLVGAAGTIGFARDRTGHAGSVFGFPALAGSFALIVAASAGDGASFGRAPVPGVRFMATITFSLYLIHKLAWHAVGVLYPQVSHWSSGPRFCASALTALAAGTAIFFCVERPFLILRDRLTAPKIKTPTVAATSLSA